VREDLPTEREPTMAILRCLAGGVILEDTEGVGEGFDPEYWKVFARAKGRLLNVPGHLLVCSKSRKQDVALEAVDPKELLGQ
jgi:hypothetical protein